VGHTPVPAERCITVFESKVRVKSDFDDLVEERRQRLAVTSVVFSFPTLTLCLSSEMQSSSSFSLQPLISHSQSLTQTHPGREQRVSHLCLDSCLSCKCSRLRHR
jgi:hypothetical protein